MSIRSQEVDQNTPRKRQRSSSVKDDAASNLPKKAKTSAVENLDFGEKGDFPDSPVISPGQQAPTIHHIKGTQKASDPAIAVQTVRTGIAATTASISPPSLPLTADALHLLNHSNRLEGHESSSMASESTEDSTLDSTPGSINASKDIFEAALEARRVYYFDDAVHTKPAELDELWDVIAKPRDSPEPSDADAKALHRAVDKAKNEAAIVDKVLPKLISFAAIEADTDCEVASNEAWHRNSLSHDLEPNLTTPKPDHTIGWNSHVFKYEFEKACKFLSAWIYPISGNIHLAWPLFTIEQKGSKGSMNVAKRQNLHNAAVMLSNLLALKEKAQNTTADKIDESFFDKIHVMGMELTDQTVSLSCYWVARSDTGIIRYIGTRLQIWALCDRTGDSYKLARRCIRNAMDHVKTQALGWIRADMETIEAFFTPIPYSKITPPPSLFTNNRVRKSQKPKSSTKKSRSSIATTNIPGVADATAE